MTQSRVRIGVVGCGVVATAYYLPYMIKWDYSRAVSVTDVTMESDSRTAAIAE